MYAIVRSGNKVKGTKYNSAGWAALNTWNRIYNKVIIAHEQVIVLYGKK